MSTMTTFYLLPNDRSKAKVRLDLKECMNRHLTKRWIPNSVTTDTGTATPNQDGVTDALWFNKCIAAVAANTLYTTRIKYELKRHQ